MGIRYWGQPLPAHLVETAGTNPRLLHIDDDYDDYLWQLREDESDGDAPQGCSRHSLDLDKTFSDFRNLWHIEPPKYRPAIELVDGWVTNHPRGWIPHYGIVAPDRVGPVRDDIVRTNEAEITSFITAGPRRFGDEPDLYVKYLTRLRGAMITFLDERLARGEGVLYTIG